MITSPAFLRFSKIVLVFVFLVIMAGAVVRMTQSGMGCPDWPKCFGKWIPPTDSSQLPPDFEKYLKKQDIDHSFNVFHTWTEYINRLLGAILGLLMLVQLAWAIKLFRKKNMKIVWLCLGLLLLTGFQGWLGKRVVDANLATVKITTHMLVALLIAMLALVIVHLQGKAPQIHNSRLKNITLIAIFLLLVQIALGTGVREQIDHISKELNYGYREYWISRLNYVFYIHRSFSLLVTALCVYIYVQVKKSGIRVFSNTLMIASTIASVVLGIIMAYGNVPAFAQPLHLLFSSLLFIGLCNSWLKTVR
ncbi:MAG TPA: COX15/CtaA family protein [Ferruginibacter sp.]|nr:COX15/CtaA family protein [Ferruginibacter sp.]HMP19548.1 COX15/CtaA family protein [Ferruginibacter sp.]